MKYDVRQTFFGLVMEELGTTLSPSARENLYVKFCKHFNVTSEIQIYAVLTVDTAAVRAWIRENVDE